MRWSIVSALLVLSLLVLSQPAVAATLSGTVFSQGAPVANLTITVQGTDIKTKTGPNGEYKLELAPGDHVLIIRGKEFPVTVDANHPTKHDVQL